MSSLTFAQALMQALLIFSNSPGSGSPTWQLPRSSSHSVAFLYFKQLPGLQNKSWWCANSNHDSWKSLFVSLFSFLSLSFPDSIGAAYLIISHYTCYHAVDGLTILLTLLLHMDVHSESLGSQVGMIDSLGWLAKMIYGCGSMAPVPVAHIPTLWPNWSNYLERGLNSSGSCIITQNSSTKSVRYSASKAQHSLDANDE